MQVNVFVVRGAGDARNRLLVLPLAPGAAIPKELSDEWTYFCTVDTQDTLLAASARRIEAEIEQKGHCVVDATE